MGIRIGQVTIYYYGIVVMLGALVAAWLAAREARRKGANGEIVWDGLVWVLIGGIVGARIWHILTPPASMVALGYTTGYYLTHPLDALNIRAGGLGIPGAVIGGLLALFLFTRRRKLEFAFWLDITAPALALGQAIGRWGNWANQEAFGRPSDLPWAVAIDPAHRPAAFAGATHFQPTFLYESLFDLANAAVLAWLALRVERPGGLRPGDVLWIYFILYGVARFVIEGMRTDSLYIGPLPAAYWLSLALIAIGATMLLLRHATPGARQAAVANEDG